MSGMHELINNHFTKYSNDDYEWCHYVHDFYERIKMHAHKIILNPYKLNVYKYRLGDFLAECNVPREADWIVLMLNQLDSEKDFEHLMWMYVPDMDDLDLIRQEFDTVQAHYNSIQNGY